MTCIQPSAPCLRLCQRHKARSQEEKEQEWSFSRIHPTLWLPSKLLLSVWRSEAECPRSKRDMRCIASCSARSREVGTMNFPSSVRTVFCPATCRSGPLGYRPCPRLEDGRQPVVHYGLYPPPPPFHPGRMHCKSASVSNMHCGRWSLALS